MALQKQPIQLNFAQGLDLKTDPNQVQLGKFLLLRNAVFQNGGGLQKRNGYGNITTVSDTSATGLATLKDNLIATGSILQAYSATTDTWLNRGTIQPVNVNTMSIVRSSTGQSKPDVAVSANGQACSVFVDNSLPYYIITDLATGQVIKSRTALPSTATTPRVFCLDNHFVIVFAATVAGNPNLQYVAVPYLNPSSPTTATTISTTILSISTAFDGYVVGGVLYLAYTGNDGGGAIRMNYMNSALSVSSATAFAGKVATAIAVYADTAPSTGSGPNIWVAFYDSATNKVHNMCVSSVLGSILSFTEVFTGVTATHVTCVATGSVCTTYIDNQSSYSFGGRSDYISYNTCTQAGVAGTAATLVRSVQLASKAFIDNSVQYFLASYETPSTGYQNTYFLINGSGVVVAKLAQGNGGGYYTDQKLTNVTSDGSSWYTGYLYKSSLVSINKETAGTNGSSIFATAGLNLASFAINSSAQYHEEIGQSLHLTGGFLWQYDGAIPVEHSFHLWPDAISITTATGAGSLSAQDYYYKAVYEWTDANGILHRSAPSLPVKQTTTTASSTNTIKVPTLRLTAKVSPNPVRIVLYRYSTAQPVYYQCTSVSSPTANDTTADTVTIVDALADSSILGNTLLYTTGGVVENIAAPACAAATLFRNRLVVLDAEDRNLLWCSKTVIDQTPVEMSDLLTIFVAPTASAQGPTGPVIALSSMDDKLIIFKKSAIYYLTGNGPDNTGANNDFSEPIYITGTVGTSNPRSVVFTPVGIMFSSDKGIWLLGRDLSTKYIGADVEGYNSRDITSAQCIPGTNQVRFMLDNGEQLMYDYYYNQWGTFSGIPVLDSTLYQGRHTYLAVTSGLVRQETPGLYTDGSTPVLLSFKTAWAKLAGLQGFQRAYFLYLLSEYISPHKLHVQIAYDYATSASQDLLITPAQLSNTWGSSSYWGGDSWGLDTLEQNRIFLSQQKCQSIQVQIDEVYDSSQGVDPGAGFKMSSMLLIIGTKLGYAKLPASQSNG